MRKIILLFLVLSILYPTSLRSQNQEDERRIEEEKRSGLSASEPRILEEKKPFPEKSRSIEEAYFRSLLSKKVAQQADLCQVLVILMGVDNRYRDFNSQVDFFNHEEIIPKSLVVQFHPKDALNKGLAAYMFFKALKIKGGLWLRIFGPSQRYALRDIPHADVAVIGEGEKVIVSEFAAVRGKPADLGGYFHGEPKKVAAVMRPSATLNAIIG